MKDSILITGCAGFIGFHTAQKLLSSGEKVIGIDIINNYYSSDLKEKRLAILKKNKNFTFYKQDISKGIEIKESPKKIIHLAAQPGVRSFIDTPEEYETNNNLVSLKVFEYARKNSIEKIIYASSSSVYGNTDKKKSKETDSTDLPISVYAATKKYQEALAHVYHKNYGINMIGLRFFNVYGEYGRPDMAYFKFAKKMLLNETIDVYNNGDHERDFTYIDDVTEGIMLALKKAEGYKIYNIGNQKPITLLKFISIIEKNLGTEAKKNFTKMQKGDVRSTCADIKKSRKEIGYNPKTDIEAGLKKFCSWFLKNKEFLLKI